ncbi:MAG: putative cobaltochelatase [Desulfomonile sp.]
MYPFSAIIGQDRMKMALILNAIDSGIGGVLVRGEKGTAKSTAVRALADLLPEITVVQGCPYSCHPDYRQGICSACHDEEKKPFSRKMRVVNLPLNATEDMVLGGIDFGFAVRTGATRFQPGLLAKANRGILYVDEINLLDDHIVDIILDAASSGENVVEREGISFRHQAQFILVGTMNPEEGELRPQLLDRFGLCVHVNSEVDPEKRVLLMERREHYDADTHGFSSLYRNRNREIAGQIVSAGQSLTEVILPKSLTNFIVELCVQNNVAGHRADIVIARSATAIAAYESRSTVTVDDIGRAAELALLHRRREISPPPPKAEEEKRSNPQNEAHEGPDDEQTDREQRQLEAKESAQSGLQESRRSDEQRGREKPSETETVFQIGPSFKVKSIFHNKDRILRRGSGKRSRTRTSQKQGRYVKSTQRRENNDLALDATLRAAAPYQKSRKSIHGLAVTIKGQDIRERIKEKRVGNFLLFLVDASGSMGARGRMIASKGAILSLLLDAYQKRDRVALVSFRKREAFVNLPPTSSVELAAKLLKDMPIGGRTPLSAGLAKSYELLRNHLVKEPSSRPITIIVTDAKANAAFGDANPLQESLKVASAMAQEDRVKFVVVDTEEQGVVRFGLAVKLAGIMGAEYFKIEDLKADALLDVVRISQ